MKLISKKEQLEVLEHLSDILVKAAYVSENNSSVFDIVNDHCQKIARIIDDKSGVFEMKKTLVEINLEKAQRSL